MEIIKRGRPTPVRYIGTCSSCGSIMEAKLNELNYEEDEKRGGYFGKCPICAEVGKSSFVLFDEKRG